MIEKQIETLLLSDLLKASDIRNHYRILRSGKHNCIYSLLESNDDYELITTSYDVKEKYSHYSTHNKYALGINFVHLSPKNNTNLTEIYLLNDVFDITKYIFVRSDDWSPSYILINDTLHINVDLRYIKNQFPLNFTIKDLRSGSIFLNIAGYAIDIRNFYVVTSYTRIYDMFKQAWKYRDRDEINKVLHHFNISVDDTNVKEGKVLKGSIGKTYDRLKQYLPKLKETDYLSYCCFQIFVNNAPRTINNISSAVIFNAIFADVKTFDDFLKICQDLSNYINDDNVYYDDNFITLIQDNYPVARDIKKSTIKKKATGAFNKIMADLDFIKIDQEKYPLTYNAVMNGEIPINTFFRKSGETYFMFNDNWVLWEQMLLEYKDIAIEIAASASARTTYEKDIMSYFHFVLNALPEYLGKHTGKKWKGIPKFVNSSNELDIPREDGTTKTRSALTPTVDNDNLTITVPYVAMKIYGQQTQYCYALDYNILTRGLSYKGNVVTNELEYKLNGRDDYGLMFYTLTGSSTATGYPTFLIIFERLENNTRVHFHRTH